MSQQSNNTQNQKNSDLEYFKKIAETRKKFTENKELIEASKKYGESIRDSYRANQLSKSTEILPGEIRDKTGGYDYQEAEEILGEGNVNLSSNISEQIKQIQIERAIYYIGGIGLNVFILIYALKYSKKLKIGFQRLSLVISLIFTVISFKIFEKDYGVWIALWGSLTLYWLLFVIVMWAIEGFNNEEGK